MPGLRPQQFGRERKILPDPDFKKHKLPYSHFRNDLMYRNAMPNHLNYLNSLKGHSVAPTHPDGLPKE